MNRRHLLLGTAGLALAGIVAGCATNAPVMPATVAQDVALVANGLSGALLSLPATIPVPPAAAEAVKDLQAVAQTLSTTETVSAAQPLVMRVETDLNAVLAAVNGLPGLPANVSLAITAAQVLLPVIETAVNLIVPAKATPAGMSPGEARLVLAGASR